jgi:hypothetical protein
MQMPFVGYRSWSDSTVYSSSYGYYWSSSPSDGGTLNSRFFYLDSDSLFTIYYGGYRGAGYAVRCFKNEYIKLPKTLNLFFMPSTGDVQEV